MSHYFSVSDTLWNLEFLKFFDLVQSFPAFLIGKLPFVNNIYFDVYYGFSIQKIANTFFVHIITRIASPFLKFGYIMFNLGMCPPCSKAGALKAL